MSPKTHYSKESIIDSAFEIAKDEGIEGISIRKVANKIGGSVAPIYVNFKDIDELKKAVIEKTFSISHMFYLKYKTGNPFSDIGIASLKFAKEYSAIFRDLIMKYNNYMKEYSHEYLISEMKKDRQLQGFSDDDLEKILVKMRVFQIGLSVIAANNLFSQEYNEDKLIELMETTASDIIYSTISNKEKN